MPSPQLPALSVAMIVKDEQHNLPRALASLAPFQQLIAEVCIYDTGSTDSTLDIARDAGAVVQEGYWDDDFARARNESLRMVNAPWVLLLDADDELHGDPAALAGFISQAPEDIFILAADARMLDANGRTTSSHRMARIARTAKVHFEGAVHEQLLEADGIERVVLAIPPAVLHTTHHGYQDPGQFHAKSLRNARCATRQLEQLRVSGQVTGDRYVAALADLAKTTGSIARHDEDQQAHEQTCGLYTELLELGPQGNLPLWLTAIERFAEYLLDVGDVAGAMGVMEILQEHEQDSTFLQWLVAGAALQLKRPDVAAEHLQQLDEVRYALGSVMDPVKVLTARAAASHESGDAEDALACMLTMVVEYGATGGVAEPLLALWPKNTLGELVSTLARADASVRDRIAQDFAAIGPLGVQVAVALCDADSTRVTPWLPMTVTEVPQRT